MKLLSEYFQIDRRYGRSINLERDLDMPNAVNGYVLTDRSLYALKQILVDVPDSEQTIAVTLTGVYGTGKSAFAHFLTCLCAGETVAKQNALAIAEKALTAAEFHKLKNHLPEQGCFRAIATAQREPLTHTIIRALDYGASHFWHKKAPNIAKELTDLSSEILGGKVVESKRVISIIQEVIKSAQTDVVLIIDELGKNLEYASLHPSASDIYLLQQLAELQPNSNHNSVKPSLDSPKFYLIGLLHQSFVDYGERLATLQRNEWAKIQGRFQDIPFTESPRQMTWLIGKAIARSCNKYAALIKNQAEEWCEVLRSQVEDISPELLAAAYPLHPITALVLPILCTRYAQNDRSLFTFLTSSEPYALRSHLAEFCIDKDCIPTLKLDRVYDYFIEAAGIGLASRPQLQKWVEIQTLVSDARNSDPESLKLLKTVGILNLVTSTGGLRASRDLVMWAMCDRPNDNTSQTSISRLIDKFLHQKGILHHRKQADELRIWEGSDFDIESAITDYIAACSHNGRSPELAKILADVSKLKPVVAQRHSYTTGTTRYFETIYLDNDVNWNKLCCSNHSFDGLIGYWVGAEPPQSIPVETADQKPLIVVNATNLKLLEISALEYTALQKIRAKYPEIERDKVAALEIRHRMVQAERRLDEALSQAFAVGQHQNICWIQGDRVVISRAIDFNSKLSEVCDRVYHKGLTLWNELINRRELSSQMVRALRTLIQAMLDHGDREGLGLRGNGPEVSIYTSVLQTTGIHRKEDDLWGFHAPTYPLMKSVWEAVENFCLESLEKPRTVDQLYAILDAPPYGIKRGVIPILLAAVLLDHVDDVSVYKDGTFIPVLGSEHFELLVKHPQRFAVKHFEIVGVRSQVFRELENVLRSPNINKANSKNLRNVTMLSVVKPLFQFVKKLPAYTTKTTRISSEAQAVVRTLQTAQEPDVLLFQTLPVACGLEAIAPNQEDDGTTAKQFKGKLVQILQEVQTAYDRLLNDCQSLLHDAFAVRRGDEKLREDLRVRASYLTDSCSERLLKRFVLAASDEKGDDRQWLESLLMIIADKPAESWTDADVQSFEPKLTDLARRFMNLEALQKGMVASKNKGFDARRITIARPDGQEVHKLIWLDPKDSDRLEVLVEKILSEESVQGSDRLQQALIAKLAERVMGNG
ncbi:hypothetical protein H6F44_20340 [Pseudanabaena sp. FACHB-1277]|uniref:KAP NTPase domain-containing protein n=1 Tax=Pseudanabaena cinerea FACHB-1277 TaxID=2949581 RepID=A0A926Z880_9CYAN|nr:P-loop NTPase fold protein [Pseudanabaena cinerea]MBD2152448.1 hypothetical protein [Pseudanabaena cinerea FACHB-1277]